MLFWLIPKLKYPLIVAVVFAGIVGVYYLFSGESKRTLAPVMEELSILTSRDFAEKLPRIQNIENLLVVPVVGGRDEDYQLKNIVVDAVSSQRKYTVFTWEAIEKRLESGNLWQKFLDQIGMIPGQAPNSLERATQVAELLRRANIEIDGILLVKCLFDQGARNDSFGAKIELAGTIIKTKSRDRVSDVKVKREINSTWDRLYLTHKMQGYNFVGRLLLWLALSTSFVWAAMPLSKVVLKQSNAVICSYLGVISLASAVLCWLIVMSLAPLTNLTTLLFVAMLSGGALRINYDALDYINRKLL